MKTYQIYNDILIIIAVATMCVCLAFGNWPFVVLSVLWVTYKLVTRNIYNKGLVFISMSFLEIVRFVCMAQIVGSLVAAQVFESLLPLMYAAIQLLHYIYFVLLAAHRFDNCTYDDDKG